MNKEDFLETASELKPGKYWKLPANKEHLLEEYMEDDNYLPMVKYDGYWARAIIHEDGVLIQSRGISKVTGTYGDYTEKVPHIVEELREIFPAGTIVIGELCYGNDLSKDAREVGKVLRSLAPKAVERQKSNKLQFRVFDMIAIEYTKTDKCPFESRFNTLPSLVGSEFEYVKPAKTGEAKQLLSDVWEAEGEGIILLNKNLSYKFGGAQAWHSIKVKRKLGDLEGKVIDVIEPTKIYEGKELDTWKYFAIERKNSDTDSEWIHVEFCTNDKRVKSPLFRTIPVTKPYFNGWKSGVIVEYDGRKIKMTSGTDDDTAKFLSTDKAKQLIKNGELYAVFTGMEMTKDSVRHPNLIRLRDDM